MGLSPATALSHVKTFNLGTRVSVLVEHVGYGSISAIGHTFATKLGQELGDFLHLMAS